MNFCSCSGVVIAMPAYACNGSCSCTCSGTGGATAAYPAMPGAAAPGGGREAVPLPKAGGGKMPPATDGTTTPRTQEERDAVRRLLQEMRNKAPRKGQPEEEASLPARLTVQLPADARLWVDDVECPLTSSERSFNTPVLEQGRTYYYTLKMQVQRQGAARTDSQRVLVTAGQNVNVNFREPELAATTEE
jgi:uncharacterized protein (TIGR03000 family)